MTRALRISGGVLLFVGTVWFFQGINVLPGSFMSGQPRWAVNGGIAALLGIVLLIVARRRHRASRG
jgi:hypothetical protein